MSFDSPDPKPQNVTQTTERNIPAELRPFILGGGEGGAGFLPRALEVSEAGLAPLPGAAERIEGFNPIQTAAFSAFGNRAAFGDPSINAGSGFLANALSSNPADDPQVRRQIESVQGGIVDQFNLNVAPSLRAASRNSGSFGNSGLGEIEDASRFSLARALGDAEAGILSTERGRQAQLAGLAPAFNQARVGDLSNALSVGSAIQAQGQAGRDIGFQNFLDQRTESLRNLDILGAALNTAGGGFTNATSTGQQFLAPGANPFLSAIGAGGSALGGIGTLISALSSRRRKHNIKPATGFLAALKKLPLYHWSYKGQTQRHVGPMAEEWQEIMGVGDGRTLNLFDMMSVVLGSLKELSGSLESGSPQYNHAE